MTIRQDKIARFNDKHELTLDSQFKQLVEELGELADVLDQRGDCLTFRERVSHLGETAEELNREGSTEPVFEDAFGDEALAEELADVVFVARSLAEIQDIDLTARVNEVIEENLQKDESTDGDKVTKSGLDTQRGDIDEIVEAVEQSPREVAEDVVDDAMTEAETLLDEMQHPWEDDPRLGRGHPPQSEKPCGEYHPLPCGLDEACAFNEDESVRERLQSLRSDVDDPHVQVKLDRALDLLERSERDTRYDVTD